MFPEYTLDTNEEDEDEDDDGDVWLLKEITLFFYFSLFISNIEDNIVFKFGGACACDFIWYLRIF